MIQLSDHFDYRKLLRFTLPTIVMLIFTSIYGVVDGIFVSNFVGKTPFAAVNLIMPFLMAFGTVGFMIGTGGSAIVAKTLGEKNIKNANRYFTMMVQTAVICGILLTIIGLLFIRPIASALGAEGEMLDYCVVYGGILLATLTFFILQNVFQSFLVTAERPNLGLLLTIGAGVTNMIFDYLLIVVFPMGIAGAAIATGISQIVGGAIPLFYFMCPNKSSLRLAPTKIEWSILVKASINGSSEMLSNLSQSLVSMLYNFQLIRIAGENGVAAYGVIMYANFIFTGVFFGYSIGSASIFGYHYGAGNHDELKNLFRKSLCLTGIWSVGLTALAILFSTPLARIFVGYDASLLSLTSHGFCLYALSFLFMGFNVFGSAFFTALNNGVVSAVISFLRALVFQVAFILILPFFFQTDGIWLAISGAEITTLFLTVFFFITRAKQYNYI
jgi:putative MATE family efflux protein